MHYLPSLKQIHIEEFVELHGEFYHSLNFTHVYEHEEVKIVSTLVTENKQKTNFLEHKLGIMPIWSLKRTTLYTIFAQLP